MGTPVAQLVAGTSLAHVSAADALSLELKVGRVLRGPLLGLAVFLRNLPLMLLDGFGLQDVAPAWVVVRRRSDGAEVLRVAAGRVPGAGESILAVMHKEADTMDEQTFLRRWAESR